MRTRIRRGCTVLGITVLAIGLLGCDSQRENNTTGGGALRQGNGEQNALGPPDSHPTPSSGSDPGGIGPPPQSP